MICFWKIIARMKTGAITISAIVASLPYATVWYCGFTAACSLILSLDGLKHLVIDEASLFQALHEQMGLVLIHEQVILKCSHADMLLQPLRNVKRIGPPAGGRQFTPWLKPVALCRKLVEHIYCHLLASPRTGQRKVPILRTHPIHPIKERHLSVFSLRAPSLHTLISSLRTAEER